MLMALHIQSLLEKKIALCIAKGKQRKLCRKNDRGPTVAFSAAERTVAPFPHVGGITLAELLLLSARVLAGGRNVVAYICNNAVSQSSLQAHADRQTGKQTDGHTQHIE